MTEEEFNRARFAWLDQVFADPELPGLALRIVYRLAGRYWNKDTGDAWPAQDTLAEDLGVTVKGVHLALKKLVAREHLTIARQRVKEGRSRSRYRPVIRTGKMDSYRNDSSPNDEGYRNNRSLSTGTDVPFVPEQPFALSLLDIPTSDPYENKTLFPSCARSRKNDTTEPETFAEWWRVYPRRVGRGAALKIYARLLTAGTVTADELLAGAMRYAAERSGQEPKFTKHPTTWLNGQCWLDEAAPQPVADGLLLDEAGNVVPLRRAEPSRPLTNVEIAMAGLYR
jgi:hypothetical protein